MRQRIAVVLYWLACAVLLVWALYDPQPTP